MARAAVLVTCLSLVCCAPAALRPRPAAPTCAAAEARCGRSPLCSDVWASGVRRYCAGLEAGRRCPHTCRAFLLKLIQRRRSHFHDLLFCSCEDECGWRETMEEVCEVRATVRLMVAGEEQVVAGVREEAVAGVREEAVAGVREEAVAGVKEEVVACELVQEVCRWRKPCRERYEEYLGACRGEVVPTSDDDATPSHSSIRPHNNCSEECLRSREKLQQDALGREFWSCGCGGGQKCDAQDLKAQTHACQRQSQAEVEEDVFWLVTTLVLSVLTLCVLTLWLLLYLLHGRSKRRHRQRQERLKHQQMALTHGAEQRLLDAKQQGGASPGILLLSGDKWEERTGQGGGDDVEDGVIRSKPPDVLHSWPEKM